MGNLGQELAKIRGFEVVRDNARTAFDVFTDEKGKKHNFPTEIKLPMRADSRSAGYDFYLPKDVTINPKQSVLVFTDVKAYMLEDEVLEIYIRSSLAVKQGIILANSVGIIDASYYGNENNDGNIGIALVNTSGKTIELSAGDRIAQGIFKKFLVIDEEYISASVRTGGIGSSGK